MDTLHQSTKEAEMHTLQLPLIIFKEEIKW